MQTAPTLSDHLKKTQNTHIPTRKILQRPRAANAVDTASAVKLRLHEMFKHDDPRRIPLRPEVFDLNYSDESVSKMDDVTFESIRHRICSEWNPLFQSGCPSPCCHGLEHLYETQFLRFVSAEHRDRQPDGPAAEYFEDALSFFVSKQHRKALSMLNSMATTYRFNAALEFWIARCWHSLMGQRCPKGMGLANHHFRRALSIHPTNGSMHAFYAQFSVDCGRKRFCAQTKVKCSEYKQAKQHFKKSLAVRSCGAVHFSLAKFLDEVEVEWPTAAIHYRAAIEASGGDRRLRMNYGRLLHKMGKMGSARKQFAAVLSQLKATNMHLSSLWPHFHFARLLVDCGQFEESRKHFTECLDIMDQHQNKFFSEIYYEFAKLLHFKLGDHRRAMQYITFALQESPKKRTYRKLFYRLRHCEQRGQWPQPVTNQKQCEEKEHSVEPKEPIPSNGDDGDWAQFLDESLSLSDDSDGGECLELRLCQNEFDRFIAALESEFGPQTADKYCDRFEDEGLNDIRCFLEETDAKVLDNTFLTETIGMDAAAVSLWTERVEDFREQHRRYVAWLERIGFHSPYFQKLRRCGILNLLSFAYHNRNAFDVAAIIGAKNKEDALAIWQSAQNEMASARLSDS